MRVMTFNVLHDAIRLVAAPWSTRRPLVIATIRARDPDVVCFQEVSLRQLESLTQDLADYDLVGGDASGAKPIQRWLPGIQNVARWVQGDFLDHGERCAIAVRKSGIVVTHRSSFHLSTRPGDATDPPAVTPFVVSEARLAATSGAWTCSIYNTHLGHLPWTARLMAEDLLGRLDRWWNGATQIVTGDFNALPGGSVVGAMVAPRGDRPRFADAWVAARRREGSAGTFHWGRGLPGPRLDYVFVRPDARVLCATTSTGGSGGTFPSDHAALTVELALTAPA